MARGGQFAAALSFVAALLAGSPAHAINITVESASPPTGTIPFARPSKPVAPRPMPRLRVTGMIETGDAEKLHAELARLAAAPGAPADGPLSTIELSSMGGNLIEGFEIGGLLRKFRMIAVVRKRDLCLSSCALAFLGGNAHHVASTGAGECNIEIGGKVAFHNFFLNRNGLREATSTDPVASRLQGFADARGGAAMLVKYAGEMGLQPNFVASLIGRPVEEFQYIETVGQFLAFHVCPIGLAPPSTSMEVQARNVCINSTGKAEATASLPVRAIPTDQAKLYLLERVQANMQSSRARGRLSAQLASGAVMRNRQEIDRLYDDLRAAGVALPDIVGPTFEIASGRSDTTCYVSLSPDDPDGYDVSLFGPRGFADPPNQAPANARRLFLFDKNDVVNPKP
jgi:hypothetical protein